MSMMIFEYQMGYFGTAKRTEDLLFVYANGRAL